MSKGYGIEYVDTKNLIALLQDAHDYAAANEHRADYWTCMAAYLQAKGLSYQFTPNNTTIDWKALGLEKPGTLSDLPTRCSICGRRILTNRTTGKCWRHR